MNEYTFNELARLPDGEVFVAKTDMIREIKKLEMQHLLDQQALEKKWMETCAAREKALAVELLGKTGVKWWSEAVERVKYVINYGCFANDLSNHDIADDLTFVMNKLAEENGLPAIDWEEPE